MATATFETTFDQAASEALAITRGARGALKQDIKADAVEIRAAKRNLREHQKAEVAAGTNRIEHERLLMLRSGKSSSSEMAALHHQRMAARVRLALYAFLRGRTWAQFEPNHAEECKISLQIFSLWKKLAKEFPGLEAPEALRAVCPAKWFEVKA